MSRSRSQGTEVMIVTGDVFCTLTLIVPFPQRLIEKAMDKFCYEHPVIPLCMDGAKTYVHLIIRHFSAFAVSRLLPSLTS